MIPGLCRIALHLSLHPTCGSGGAAIRLTREEAGTGTVMGGFPPHSLYKTRHRAEIRQPSSGKSPRHRAAFPRKHGPCTLHGHFGTTLAIDPCRGLPRQLEHNDKSLQVQEG